MINKQANTKNINTGFNLIFFMTIIKIKANWPQNLLLFFSKQNSQVDKVFKSSLIN